MLGESIEEAILVKDIQEEYEWLASKGLLPFFSGQQLVSTENSWYDVLTCKEKNYYFKMKASDDGTIHSKCE